MTPNDFDVVGETAYIQVCDQRGKVQAFVMVDASEVDKVIALGRWRKSGGGYIQTSLHSGGRRRELYLHRLLTGAAPGDVVDHINGNKLDNRLSNLRVVSHSQNMQNQKHNRANNTTGIRNVSMYQGSKYRVMISRKCLGVFNTLEEAGRVANRNRRAILPYAVDANFRG